MKSGKHSPHKKSEGGGATAPLFLRPCIVTGKLLEDKQEKIEALQVEIKSLNVEIMTREESGIIKRWRK